MRRALCAIMLCAAFPAAAQTRTDCTTDHFGNVHCQTNRGLVIQEPIDSAALFRDQDEQQRQQRRRDAERQIMDLINAGRCSQARDYALRNTDLDTAARVQALCPTQ